VSPEIASTCYINAGDGTGRDGTFAPGRLLPLSDIGRCFPAPPPRKKLAFVVR